MTTSLRPRLSWRQLMPLVYRNLTSQGLREELPADFKRSYLATWANNMYRFEALEKTLELLHGLGIQTLVLKGAALAPVYYKDLGARVMGDFDILVRETQFHAAANALLATGLVPVSSPEYFDCRFFHALQFYYRNGGAHVDLHCHALLSDCRTDADRSFWDASSPFRFSRTETRILAPTDQLITACVHGMIFSEPRQLRWIADAVTILRSCPGLMDWPRVLAVCQDRGLTLQMAAALNYLRDSFEQPVPPEIPRQLEEARTTLASRTLAKVLMSPGLSQSLRQKIRYHLAVYSKGIDSPGLVRWISNMPQFLIRRYETRRWWTFPIRLLADFLRVAFNKGNRLGHPRPRSKTVLH